MTKMGRLLGVFLSALWLGGCHSVWSVSLSQVPEVERRKSMVIASETAPVVIGIPFGTEYVNDARGELLRRCPKGTIKGLLTKFETVAYFGGFFYQQKVTMSGYCNEAPESPRRGTKGAPA